MKIILADESVDFRLVRKLREDDYEIEAIIETTPGIMDEEVLEAANNLEAILLTEDKDFGELTYRLQIPNHGIILLRMSGESLENKISQLYTLFKNYEEKLSTSFSVVTIQKIRVISQ
ncbi:DUF5615 family PIN-like protein [Neolewinella antarctica]|uniref:Nuclease of putative toxin-antitoxin system n=1 Tax=Neolewinella antarctica TaxID=442734 RepID=A0ABX0XGR3_9BACT|nr:DUF5615 family PIN-like protein [Neolewinella antarctica]NJC28515.1 putative nuclease of putative toxin-antitoxin system [Neolewinella antarctica]